MSLGTVRFSRGPETVQVSAEVKAGQLVMADTVTGHEGKVLVSDGTGSCMGVALGHASPAGTAPTTVPDHSWPQEDVALAGNGMSVDVQYSAAAKYGDRLVGTAAGKVAPAGATPTTEVVGKCTARLGVASGGVGTMRLYV